MDSLLPEHCPDCGEPGERPGYCPACSADLPRHQRQCHACGVPFTGADICGRCQQKPPPIDETIAPFRYAPPVSDAIHRLKYHRQLACGRDLGYLLARELSERVSRRPDVLAPVPLHWTRRFRRGFNQSMEVALPVSRLLGIPIDSRLIRRCVHTAAQVGLMPDQRRRNLRDAFSVRSGPVPASVAIVDDVVTSGATVSEAAQCLRRAGVRHIHVWAVTRV